jgi:hypothetical protein
LRSKTYEQEGAAVIQASLGRMIAFLHAEVGGSASRAREASSPQSRMAAKADATRVAYIRNFRAHVVPAASATLTEERMELETARMREGPSRPRRMSAGSR